MSGGTGVVTGLGAVSALGTVSTTELVRRVRMRLNDNPYEDKHTDVLTDVSTDTVMTVADGTKYTKGNIIEWEDYPFERALVDSVSTNDVTLHRAHDGTTISSHGANSRFLKGPTWSASLIVEAITRCIQADLFPWVWGDTKTTISPNTTETWYELPADFIDPISIFQTYDSNNKFEVYGRKGGRPFNFQHGVPAAISSTGVAASFPGGVRNTTDLVRVRYRRLVTISGATTTVEDGMMADCVVWGAITRMVADQDLTNMVDRTPKSRTGATIRSASWYRANFENARDITNAHLMQTARPASVYRR